MCTSAPKIKAPPAAPPPVDPNVINEQGNAAAMLERRRAVARAGRQSTITAGAAAPPTGQAKVALGA